MSRQWFWNSFSEDRTKLKLRFSDYAYLYLSTSLSHQASNPDFTNPELTKFAVCFDLLKTYFCLRIKIDKKMPIHISIGNFYVNIQKANLLLFNIIIFMKKIPIRSFRIGCSNLWKSYEIFSLPKTKQHFYFCSWRWHYSLPKKANLLWFEYKQTHLKKKTIQDSCFRIACLI